jgi:hypothetical protein
VLHTCNPSTWEAEAGGLRVWDYPRLHSEFEASLDYRVRPKRTHTATWMNLEWNKPTMKEQISYHFIYLGSLKLPNSQRQEVTGERREELVFNGRRVTVGWEGSGDGWWRWLHSNRNGPQVTEPNTQNGQNAPLHATYILPIILNDQKSIIQSSAPLNWTKATAHSTVCPKRSVDSVCGKGPANATLLALLSGPQAPLPSY